MTPLRPPPNLAPVIGTASTRSRISCGRLRTRTSRAASWFRSRAADRRPPASAASREQRRHQRSRQRRAPATGSMSPLAGDTASEPEPSELPVAWIVDSTARVLAFQPRDGKTSDSHLGSVADGRSFWGYRRTSASGRGHRWSRWVAAIVVCGVGTALVERVQSTLPFSIASPAGFIARVTQPAAGPRATRTASRARRRSCPRLRRRRRLGHPWWCRPRAGAWPVAPHETRSVSGASPAAVTPARIRAVAIADREPLASTCSAAHAGGRGAYAGGGLPRVPAHAGALPTDLFDMSAAPSAVPASVAATECVRRSHARHRLQASRVAGGGVGRAARPTKQRIEDALHRYRRAYTSLDAAAARSVWPSVDQRALERAFGSLKSQSLAFNDCTMSVWGTEALAACDGQATYVPRVGSQRPRTESHQWRFQLRKMDESWMIVRAEAR